MVHHVLSARQFDRAGLDRLMEFTEKLETHLAGGAHHLLAGRIMATLFYEPSTRTRLSFESAMRRLGGGVISTEQARTFSSAAKGESLEDTIRVVSGYADVIVLRHDEEGAVSRAAAVSEVPVINAGDGPGEHPTQGLLDLFTIKRECGTIDGLTVALVGDLAHGRTVHSLAHLLSNYEDVELYFVAPPRVRMPEAVLQELTARGVRWQATEDLDEALDKARVVYQTRIQRERFPDEELFRAVAGQYIIGPEQMKSLQDDAIIMHPLPRAGEIDPAIDDDPRAAYFRQAQNGVLVRMALLLQCLRVDAF